MWFAGLQVAVTGGRLTAMAVPCGKQREKPHAGMQVVVLYCGHPMLCAAYVER